MNEKVKFAVDTVNINKLKVLTVEIIEEGITTHLKLTLKIQKLRHVLFYCSTWTDFTSCVCVFIAEFEDVIV